MNFNQLYQEIIKESTEQQNQMFINNLEQDASKTNWLIYADFLEEQGHPAEKQ